LTVDALVVGATLSDEGPTLAGPLPAPLQAWLAPLLPMLGLGRGPGQVRRIPTAEAADVEAPLVIVVTLEADQASSADPTAPDAAEALRRAAGAAAREAAGLGSIAYCLPAAGAAELGAVAEGALLGSYRFDRFLTSPPPAPAGELVIVAHSPRARSAAARGEVEAAVERAAIIADAQAQVRDLVNLPPVDLFPAALAEAATEIARPAGVKVTVLDEAALAKGGYGGLIGVGQGSARPPRLIKLSWTPGRSKKHIALVGKGITFDSGGLSLKPPASMTTMKGDMAGAAAVLGAVVAAARLGVGHGVTGWLAAAENMPGGRAQRPGDIITLRDGTTVEVLNTDAEGRLVLADAIAAARSAGASAIVDIATLTGGKVTALGDRIGAVMGSPDVRERALQAAASVGEPFWPMPLPAEYGKLIETPLADIKNTAGPHASPLTAGLFLQHFAGDTPWAHLDIAGQEINEGDPYGYTPKGATGFGTRTLVALAEAFAV
jgi:leucyl aminopeptidase